jgi:hypothetical protein
MKEGEVSLVLEGAAFLVIAVLLYVMLAARFGAVAGLPPLALQQQRRAGSPARRLPPL